jgi:hypothetical protein
LLFLKQCLSRLFGVERLQVIRLLAEADAFEGQAGFLRDRHLVPPWLVLSLAGRVMIILVGEVSP